MYCNFSEAVNLLTSPPPTPSHIYFSPCLPIFTLIYSYLLLFNLIVKVKISQIKQEKNLNHLNLKMVPMLIHNCLKATVVLEIIHIFFLKTQNKFLILLCNACNTYKCYIFLFFLVIYVIIYYICKHTL